MAHLSLSDLVLAVAHSRGQLTLPTIGRHAVHARTMSWDTDWHRRRSTIMGISSSSHKDNPKSLSEGIYMYCKLHQAHQHVDSVLQRKNDCGNGQSGSKSGKSLA